MAGSRPRMPAVSTRISGHSRNAHEGSREVERSHNLRGLRERAGLCEKLGVAQAAAADLAKALELEPDALRRPTITRPHPQAARHFVRPLELTRAAGRAS